MHSVEALAQLTLRRCQVIAGFSECPGVITRTFLSPPMRQCHAFLGEIMRELRMRVSVDALGNLRGLYGDPDAPRLLLGSHLDTVPDAGAYDGVLGVCLALAVIEAVQDSELPFSIEVFGFSEEEGVRFRQPFLGSLAAVGQFEETLLPLRDDKGRTLCQALYEFGLDPVDIPQTRIDERSFAFIEFHIEQGPVLDMLGVALGAVTGIAGQSRLEAVFTGAANHAGTTPMNARRDPLCGFAQWLTHVEEHARSVGGLVATVGALRVAPGATNIIPGQVHASLDVRHSSDAIRLAAKDHFCHLAQSIAAARGLTVRLDERLDQPAVPMDPTLTKLLAEAVAKSLNRRDEEACCLVSGAGHDAMIMARQIPSAMLFLRSPGGISHHPDERVLQSDVEAAIGAGVFALQSLSNQRRHAS